MKSPFPLPSMGQAEMMPAARKQNAEHALSYLCRRATAQGLFLGQTGAIRWGNGETDTIAMEQRQRNRNTRNHPFNAKAQADLKSFPVFSAMMCASVNKSSS